MRQHTEQQTIIRSVGLVQHGLSEWMKDLEATETGQLQKQLMHNQLYLNVKK